MPAEKEAFGIMNVAMHYLKKLDFMQVWIGNCPRCKRDALIIAKHLDRFVCLFCAANGDVEALVKLAEGMPLEDNGAAFHQLRLLKEEAKKK